jgi:hypothetical protein
MIKHHSADSSMLLPRKNTQHKYKVPYAMKHYNTSTHSTNNTILLILQVLYTWQLYATTTNIFQLIVVKSGSSYQ